ncbi:MAG: carbohydrate kinase family protein [Candidatus Heimdallarchaeota archaeon]
MVDVTMNILGVGQVLWDLSVEVDFATIKELDMSVSGHRIVEQNEFDGILEKLSSQGIGEKQIIKNPGGSAANVMSNLAKLGTKTSFTGKHGDDEDGWTYMKILENEGVKPLSIIDTEEATGRLLSLITPDKDRTFIVFRGASAELPPSMLESKVITDHEIVHMEGYLIIKSERVLEKIFEEAEQISFDLAAADIIKQTRPILQQLMQKKNPYVLFANLLEGKEFTQKENPKDILDSMLKYTENAVLTLGEEGVLVKTATGEEHKEPANKTTLVDTTGAGDSFSAGFLHEFLKNKDIKKATKLGTQIASSVISELGARSFKGR